MSFKHSSQVSFLFSKRALEIFSQIAQFGVSSLSISNNSSEQSDKPSTSDNNFEGSTEQPSKMPVKKTLSTNLRSLTDDDERIEIENEIEDEGKIQD